MTAKILILSGDGVNCENETAEAFHTVGLKTDIIHINSLLKSKTNLQKYQGMALPGKVKIE